MMALPHHLETLVPANTAIKRRAACPSAPPDEWTSKLAGETLVAALGWARRFAGPVGPQGIVTARMPEAMLTLEQRLELGWGLPETADPDDVRPMVIRPSPRLVSRHTDALAWPAVYLGENEGSRQMVSLWAGCKAYSLPFNEAVKRRGTIDRSAAYRLRDRGLTLIALGLIRDRVSVEVE